MRTKLGVLFFLLLTIQCKEKIENITESKIIEEYYGKHIEDPYRWLENQEDSTTIDWLKIEKEKANKIINKNSGYSNIIRYIKSYKNNEELIISKLKITENDHYFYLKKRKNDSTIKLYFRNGLSGKEELLYDPLNYNSNSEETFFINYIQPSWDSKKIVISLSKNDEEFSELLILDVLSKKIISDKITNTLPNALGGVEWLPNNNGFIYTSTPVIDKKDKDYGINKEAKLYNLYNRKSNTIFSKNEYPEISFDKEDAPIIYFTNPKNNFFLGAIANVSRYRETFYEKTNSLNSEKLNWKKLYGKKEKIRQFFLFGNDFYYRTAKNASNFKICKTDLRNPDFENPKTLINEFENTVISDFAVTKDGVYFVRTKNGVDAKLFFQNHNGTKIIPIKLPKQSGHVNISSKSDDFSDLSVTIEGWTSFKEIYSFDINSSKFKYRSLQTSKTPSFLNETIVEEIEIESHDGVMVPLSIVYKKGTKLDGSNRLLLNAYGAYKWSNSPYLYQYLLHWVKEGGIYATAHVRGGGEKGDDWHIGGFKTTKPNSWKDLISSTEYLIENKYCNEKKIALWGASAGGITIGRAITERPDLYTTAVIRVGSINMLRSEFGPNGNNNTKEFGTVKDSIEFNALLEMDAYHHIKKGVKYPSVYFTAGMNDTRVPVWLSSKFAARLQASTSSKKPILFDVDFEGGHGFEASKNKKDTELAKIMSFLFWQTGHPDYQLNE